MIAEALLGRGGRQGYLQRPFQGQGSTGTRPLPGCRTDTKADQEFLEVHSKYTKFKTSIFAARGLGPALCQDKGHLVSLEAGLAWGMHTHRPSCVMGRACARGGGQQLVATPPHPHSYRSHLKANPPILGPRALASSPVAIADRPRADT